MIPVISSSQEEQEEDVCFRRIEVLLRAGVIYVAIQLTLRAYIIESLSSQKYILVSLEIMNNHSESATPVLQQLKYRKSNHQSTLSGINNTSKVALLAQGGTLYLLIVAVCVVNVGEQRRDAHCRNDPSKYGLKSYLTSNVTQSDKMLLGLWVD